MMAQVFTEWQDAIITKIYSAPSFAERRKRMKTYFPKLAPVTRGQAYQRAIKLGVLKPLTKPLPWTEEEIDLLERYTHLCDSTLARLLKKHGFTRTQNAVHLFRLRHVVGYRQGKIDAGVYTACQVADIVGANSHTVTTWINKGWLKAKRGTAHGPHLTYEIKQSDLRNFIIHHVAYCDLGRADKFTLIDILCPHGAKEAGTVAA